jgi:type IV pilus assembly protein PilC
MIRAGETGGFLAEILERLADYMERAAALRRKVKMAMLYPSVVITIALLITVLLIVKVVPVFEEMFKDFGADLPAPTQFMINLSHFLRNYGLFVIAGIVLLFLLFKWYKKTPRGRFKIDKIKFKLPLFGALIQKVCVARFSSTLAALVQSGVPIIRSLEIVSETSGNEVINQVLRDAMIHTEKGEPIAESLRQSKYIPPMVSKMIEIGEATGRLDTMLIRIEKFYTEQVNAAVNGLTTLIEPMLIVFLGVVVGGIVISMFMPIFQLSEIVS